MTRTLTFSPRIMNSKKTDEEIRADLESCIQAMIEPEDASDRMHYRKTVRTMRRAEKRIAELSPRAHWLPINTAPAHRPILLWWRHCDTPRVGRYVADETGEGWKCDGDECIPKNQQDCLYWHELPSSPVSDDGSYGHTIDNNYR